MDDITKYISRERVKQNKILNKRRKFISITKITGNLQSKNIAFDEDYDLWLIPNPLLISSKRLSTKPKSHSKEDNTRIMRSRREWAQKAQARRILCVEVGL